MAQHALLSRAPTALEIAARLELLERQISLVSANIASQIKTIENKRGRGIDTGYVEITLTRLMVTLRAREAERDEMRAEFDAPTLQ
jgi:hypothetical protein